MRINVQVEGTVKLRGRIFSTDLDHLSARIQEAVRDAVDEALLDFPEMEYVDHEIEVKGSEDRRQESPRSSV